ncbi:MAG: GGDEF domain-containing protein [Gammaproteobacteria bacterium]|nr:GGDEF domain-containing protein [Gammaproteobacteria bacterium]NNJ71633.1 GGDEF domain-containing protein [Enterobacterales bacterium]
MQQDNKLKILRRSSSDIARRSLAGVFIYPLFWPIIAYGSGFHHEHPTIVLALTTIHIIVSAARLSHIYAIDKISDDKLSAWMKVSYVLLFTQALAWGAMFGFAMLASNEEFQFYMTLSAAGIAAGGTNTFAPNKWLSRGFSIFCFGPGMVIAIYQNDLIMTAIMLAYLLYIFGLGQNQYKEYWRSIDNEMKLEGLSVTDELTQLGNRRGFNETLLDNCHVSARQAQPVSVLIVDIDFFKKINDDHGHDVGDICIQHIAKMLKLSMPRKTDFCARYGGEEFAGILPGTSLQGAKIVAERIRNNIATNPVSHANGEINMTVSIGVSSKLVNKFEDSVPKALLKESDLALYQAKENGRNQTICYEPTNSPAD